MTTARFQHFELPGGLRLGINSNRKLKTILVKSYLISDLDETVTRRSLLPSVLRRGSRRLPDMQVLYRHLEEMYGASLHSHVAKIGEWHLTKYQIDVVNDCFLPRSSAAGAARQDLFGKSLEFLRDLIFDPLVEGEGFRPEYVEQEKATLRHNIESLIDDKAAYAVFRCVEEMCRDEPYRWYDQGRVEDLETIEPAGLHRQYLEWYDRSPLAIYAAGDIDVDRTREALARVFASGRSGSLRIAPPPAPLPVGEVREVRERLDVHQARLVLGFRHDITYCDPRYEALLVMNGVLGAYSHSKLFQNVREKASLAYSAHSWPERTKGLLFIHCGISSDKYAQVLEIVLEQVEALRKGEISDEEIEATRQSLLNQNRMLEDNFSALADIDYVWSLHGRELDLPAFRRRLQSVTRGEIVEAALRLRHDTTYFLHN